MRGPPAAENGRGADPLCDWGCGGRGKSLTPRRKRSSNFVRYDWRQTMSSRNEQEGKGINGSDITESGDDIESQMRSIQTDLEQVEEQLQSTPARGRGSIAGRAIFNSIRDTLGSIRSRLESAAERDGVARSDGTTGEVPTPRSLFQRLRTAEMAHSHRIPLGMMQSEMSRRQSSGSSSAARTTGLRRSDRHVKKNDSTREELGRESPYGTNRSSSTRRASILLASRRLAEEAEGPQADMDLHGTIPIFPSVIAEEPVEEEVVFEEQKKEGMEVERQESIEEGLPEASEKQEEHEKEVPILLTQKTQSRLDLAHGSVLFSSHRFEKLVQETMPENKTIVYSWGSGVNSLHDDDEDVALEHARVDSASRVGRTDIMSCSAGPNHAACSTAAGQVLICGRNNTGAVDPDRRGEELIKKPALLESLGEARIVQVSCGFDHTAALRANGAILTWGSNEFGQLGHRLPKNAKPDPASLKFCRPSIMVLGPGRRATAVVCGDGFSLCLTSRMGVLACGREFISGYSEKEGCYHLPAPIPALEDLPLVSVSAGRRHAVVVSAHGSAFAWGENAHGCCGREYPKETSVPVPINVPESRLTPRGPALPKPLSSWAYWEEDSVSLAKDTAVVDAACGDEHTVLVTRSGRLLVCGSNSRGQLGLDPKLKSVVYSVEPVNHQDAGNGRRFVRAEAGQDHTLLLDDMGDVWQLGGDMDSGYEQVLEGKHVQWIAAGGGQNIAIASVPGRSPLRREFSDATGAGDVPLAENVEELIRLLPDEKKAKGNEEQPLGIAANELATRMEELLRTPAVLNSLFLDPTELEDLFAKLLSADNPQVQQTIASAIEKGIQRGLDSVRSDDARLMWPEQVRFLLLYIQCPLFLVWKKEEIFFDRRSDLILCLCETILEMSYEGYCALMCWATSIYPRELFVRLLVDPLLSQLEKAITIGAGAQTRPIPALVSVLRWLYNASERAGGIARPEDFYSSALGNMNPEALLNDLVKYKKASKQERGADFFFCDNPFLFSPSTKRNLLQIESEMNMLKTAAAGLTYNAEERAYEFNPFYVLDIDREHLLTQALDKVSKAEPSDLRKKLRVVFKGEDGVDAGGVTREFFQLLSAHLFDINTGMWSTRFEDGQVTWFNSDCSWNDEGYFLCGVLVGLAVYNSVLLDVNFPPAVYRKLLGLPLGLEDMVDEEVKSGLQQLLDYEGDDVEDIFCLTFDVNWMDLGVEKRRELKPGGSNIPVTSANKEEYVLLYVKWILVDSIYPQYEAFEAGFMKVMENSSLDLLRPEELELLVVGTPELDFEALEKNTKYEGGYDADSDVVKNFWRFVKNAPPDTQLDFLRFATGSTRAPIGGLGEMSFKIQRAGPDSDQLPTSHTCFNTLLLPDYGDNYEKLERNLGRAILECEGFGLQ